MEFNFHAQFALLTVYQTLVKKVVESIKFVKLANYIVLKLLCYKKDKSTTKQT